MAVPAPLPASVPTAGPRRPRGRAIDVALVLAGVALLAFLVRGAGIETIVDNLRLVGWGIVLIVGQEVLAVVANTLGWWAAFPRPRPALPFRLLVAARLVGDAVNYVTPTASLGGELVRGRLLRGRAGRLDVVTSIAVAKLTQSVAQVAFIALGMVLIVRNATLPHAWRVAFGVVTVGLALAAAALIVVQRRGMFSALARLVALVDRRGRFPALSDQMARLDTEIARAHDRHAHFVVSCAWFFVGWALGALEIYLMLWLLALPASVTLALTIEVLSEIIDAALFFVPSKLGTQEGGKVLIFSLLALDTAKGLSVGVLRRIRELTWAAAGLLILLAHRLAGEDLALPAPLAPPRE